MRGVRFAPYDCIDCGRPSDQERCATCQDDLDERVEDARRVEAILEATHRAAPDRA